VTAGALPSLFALFGCTGHTEGIASFGLSFISHWAYGGYSVIRIVISLARGTRRAQRRIFDWW
jgi:hypothetical protein